MDGQYNRLVWCINTRTIPRCIGETKMASNNENGIGHLRALVPWLIMMMMMRSHGVPASGSHDFKSGCFRIWTPYSLFLAKGLMAADWSEHLHRNMTADWSEHLHCNTAAAWSE